MALEKMDAFFDARVDGYDQHMREEVDRGSGFYAETAKYVPHIPKMRLLDLGCGTGLELEEIFRDTPDARVTGIDLSEGMLGRLREKFPDKDLTLCRESYFDAELGEEIFDAAVSVESLHHFERAQKTELYRKIARALKKGGVYVETDYVAPDQAYEDFYFAENARLRKDAGVTEGFYHYDTPHTVENLLKMRGEAGFSSSRLAWKDENTAVIVSVK